ncbi:unnamed protein product [Trichobilharzia regenti]|nr:unnamed protein product [Trichobilharzia regenti]
MVAFYTDWFYNMIIAWSLYYLGVSFTSNLPWMTCGNPWNTERCTDIHLTSNDSVINWKNVTIQGSNNNNTFPVEEFFSNQVLGRTKDTNVENLGKLQWQVLLCFIAVMVICYFSLWKGIHTSGKVVWFTALFPYVVLIIFLFRGLTLPGSTNGIYHYIWPDIGKLKYAEPWIDAATQVFFSLGPGFGVLMAYASYNDFHNNVYRQVYFQSLMFIFSYYITYNSNGYTNEREFIFHYYKHPVLVFSVYPEALSTLPGSTFLSICFFLMLLTLGLDSSVSLFKSYFVVHFILLLYNQTLFTLALRRILSIDLDTSSETIRIFIQNRRIQRLLFKLQK